jgi:hypothetical protein
MGPFFGASGDVRGGKKSTSRNSAKEEARRQSPQKAQKSTKREGSKAVPAVPADGSSAWFSFSCLFVLFVAIAFLPLPWRLCAFA